MLKKRVVLVRSRMLKTFYVMKHEKSIEKTAKIDLFLYILKGLQISTLPLYNSRVTRDTN